MSETESKNSAWERHAQTVLAGLVMLVLAWVGASVNELTGQMVRFEEKLSASQNLSMQRDIRIQRHEESIQDLHLRVDRLERVSQ